MVGCKGVTISSWEGSTEKVASELSLKEHVSSPDGELIEPRN